MRRIGSYCWRGLHACREVLQRLMMWVGQVAHPMQEFRRMKTKTIKRCPIELEQKSKENPFCK
jgi:hypothetical protein